MRDRLDKVQLNPRLKNHNMRTAPKMEHPQLVTFVHFLANVNRKLTRRDLPHADEDNSHQPYRRVARLDVHDAAGGDGGDVRLAVIRRRVVRRLARIRRLGETGEEVGAVVCPRHVLDVYDAAGDGRVPAVVGERAEVGLVDGPAYEGVGERVEVEHVG